MANASPLPMWLKFALAVGLALFAWKFLHAPQREPLPRPSPSASAPSDSSTPRARDAAPTRSADAHETDGRYPAFLPPEAIDTLRLIERGGPYPHRQDDGVFGNRENRLPSQPRGYYREYTVETPGSRDRGARRIIAGGQPPVEFFYTDDHYRSFRRFAADGTESAR